MLKRVWSSKPTYHRYRMTRKGEKLYKDTLLATISSTHDVFVLVTVNMCG